MFCQSIFLPRGEIVINIDITWVSYFMLFVVSYYLMFFLTSFRKPRLLADLKGSGQREFVIVVPARNEESVLGDTLRNLTSIIYDGDFRILVINDASNDGTQEIIDEYSQQCANVRGLERVQGIGGTGKSDALNHAFKQVSFWESSNDSWLGGYSAEDIVFVIVDADGQLEANSLEIVDRYFQDPDVGSTQIGVRIYNATDSILPRLQDMEFVGFSYLVQMARDYIGSIGLGGNGQFTRLSALRSLGENPWSSHALTEDLDLGLKLVEAGWKTKFCHFTQVSQEGLNTWKPLLRQRTRWIQGHYQCWSHIPKLLQMRGPGLLGRLDLVLYLILVVTIVVSSYALFASTLSQIGLINVTTHFLDFMPKNVWYRAVTLMLSLLPLFIFMTTYQLNAKSKLRWWEVPAYSLMFTLYSYVWLITTFRAWFRMATGKGGWVKTTRVKDRQFSA